MIDLLERGTTAVREPAATAPAEVLEEIPAAAPTEYRPSRPPAGPRAGLCRPCSAKSCFGRNGWTARITTSSSASPRTPPMRRSRKAYFQLARKCHRTVRPEPDAGHQGPGRRRLRATGTKAYRTLIDRGARARITDQKLAGPQEEAGNQAQEEGGHQGPRGRTLFNQGRYEGPSSFSNRPSDSPPTRATTSCFSGWPRPRPRPQPRRPSRISWAIELEPWNPEGLVALGMLYKHEGLTAKARRQFEKALTIDAGTTKMASSKWIEAAARRRRASFSSVFKSGKEIGRA